MAIPNFWAAQEASRDHATSGPGNGIGIDTELYRQATTASLERSWELRLTDRSHSKSALPKLRILSVGSELVQVEAKHVGCTRITLIATSIHMQCIEQVCCFS